MARDGFLKPEQAGSPNSQSRGLVPEGGDCFSAWCEAAWEKNFLDPGESLCQPPPPCADGHVASALPGKRPCGH